MHVTSSSGPHGPVRLAVSSGKGSPGQVFATIAEAVLPMISGNQDELGNSDQARMGGVDGLRACWLQASLNARYMNTPVSGWRPMQSPRVMRFSRGSTHPRTGARGQTSAGLHKRSPTADSHLLGQEVACTWSAAYRGAHQGRVHIVVLCLRDS